MKLSKLLQSHQDVSKLKLPTNLAFDMVKVAKRVNEEVEAFNQVRNDKIKEFGKEKTEGKGDCQITPEMETWEQFIKEINELSEKEIEIDLPEISREDIKNDSIEVEVLMRLDWLIK